MRGDGQGGERSLERGVREGLSSGTFGQGPEWGGRASYVDMWQEEKVGDRSCSVGLRNSERAGLAGKEPRGTMTGQAAGELEKDRSRIPGGGCRLANSG